MELKTYIYEILNDCSLCSEIKIEVGVGFDRGGKIVVDQDNTNRIVVTFKEKD